MRSLTQQIVRSTAPTGEETRQQNNATTYSGTLGSRNIGLRDTWKTERREQPGRDPRRGQGRRMAWMSTLMERPSDKAPSRVPLRLTARFPLSRTSCHHESSSLIPVINSRLIFQLR